MTMVLKTMDAKSYENSGLMAIFITNSQWFGGKNLAGSPYLPNLCRGPFLDRKVSSEVQATEVAEGTEAA